MPNLLPDASALLAMALLVRRGLVFWWTLSLIACEAAPVDEDPVRVTKAFIERMRSVHGDPGLGRKAVDLLWERGRDHLQERAKRATAAAGQKVAPEEMLVPSMFSLNFEPKSFTAQTRGEYALVTATGSSPKEVAEIHCVRENGAWRVVVEFPALPPIQSRDG